jgi:DNA-binding XRE family transcriptional regulator
LELAMKLARFLESSVEDIFITWRLVKVIVNK